MNSESMTDALGEDFVAKAQEGKQKVEAIPCSEVAAGLMREYDSFQEIVNQGIIGADSLHDTSATIATAIMTLDRKRCLMEVMTDEDVLNRLENISQLKGTLIREFSSSPHPDVGAKLGQAFKRLSAWQQALVAMGTKFVDRRLLFPDEIGNIFNCPQPCYKCTREHNSIFKPDEKFKFKCLMKSQHKDKPPSLREPRLRCDKPKRRTSVFWEYKTWCSVPGWIADAYQNARISATIACGSQSLLSTLKFNETMPEELMRICMLVEQRMAVTMPELRSYKNYLAKEEEAGVPNAAQHAFAIIMSVSTAQGLAGLRESAEDPPTSDDDWERLIRDGNYTLLPPGLVTSVPCEPPVNNRELFYGTFAAVLAIGAGVTVAVLAVMPLVFFVGLFFSLAAVGILPGLIFGVVLAAAIPQIWRDVFSKVADKVYNALFPEAKAKACPRALLSMSEMSKPVCIADLAKLEAKRYVCPSDKSRSMVVSCEPEFNGVVALRGEACP